MGVSFCIANPRYSWICKFMSFDRLNIVKQKPWYREGNLLLDPGATESVHWNWKVTSLPHVFKNDLLGDQINSLWPIRERFKLEFRFNEVYPGQWWQLGVVEVIFWVLKQLKGEQLQTNVDEVNVHSQDSPNLLFLWGLKWWSNYLFKTFLGPQLHSILGGHLDFRKSRLVCLNN